MLPKLLLTALVVVILAGAIIFVLYSNDMRQARAAVDQGSLIAETAAGPIEYADRASGTPVLSIHGAGGGFDQGLANAADWFGDGFRIIAPSRFGYLRTPIPSDASPAAQADAHAALLSELKISRAIVLGVSAGARSAIELAVRHPDNVSALILIVPGTYSPEIVPIEETRGSDFPVLLWLVDVGADFAWWTIEHVAPSLLVRFVGVPPDLLDGLPASEREQVMNIVRSVEPLSRRYAGITVDGYPDLGELPLETIKVPTLIVSARDDLFSTLQPAEYAASRIPGAKLVIYDTGGHLLVGHRQEVRDVVQAFSAGLSPVANAL